MGSWAVTWRKNLGIIMKQHIELITYMACMASHVWHVALWCTLMFGSLVWTQGSLQGLSFTKCSFNGFPLRCYPQELVLKACSDILWQNGCIDRVPLCRRLFLMLQPQLTPWQSFSAAQVMEIRCFRPWPFRIALARIGLEVQQCRRWNGESKSTDATLWFFHVKAIRERLERVSINWSLPLKKFPNSSGWKRRLLLLLRRFWCRRC